MKYEEEKMNGKSSSTKCSESMELINCGLNLWYKIISMHWISFIFRVNWNHFEVEKTSE